MGKYTARPHQLDPEDMAESPTADAVERAVAEVRHPEIDATLQDLGMIQDVAVSADAATTTLALPMLNIPEAIRDILVSRLRTAMAEAGADPQVEIVVMTDAQRERFFELETEHWSGLDEEADDTAEPPF